MSITILRTADAWWVRTPRGAARVDTDATTTGELLAEPEKTPHRVEQQEDRRRGHARPALPGDGPVPRRGPDDELRQPREGRRARPRDHPADLLPQDVGLDQRPVRRHRPAGARALPGLRGRDRPGDRPRAAGGHPGHRGQLDLVRRRPRGDQRRVGPRRAAAEDPVLRVQVLPDVHPGRTRAGAPGPRRAQAVRRPAAAPVGQRRAAPGRGGRRRHDLLPADGAAGAEPVPAARRGRPAPDRDPGGHRPERAAEAGRDHRRPPAARAEVEAVLPAPGPEPQVPQGTATSSSSPSAPTTARSTSAGSAPSSGAPDGRPALADVRRPRRPRRHRGGAAGRPWPARHDLRAPRAGRPPVAGPGSPVRPARR